MIPGSGRILLVTVAVPSLEFEADHGSSGEGPAARSRSAGMRAGGVVAVLALRRDPWVRAGMAGSPLMLNTIRKRLISPRTPLITLEVEVRLTKVQREEHDGGNGPDRPPLPERRRGDGGFPPDRRDNVWGADQQGGPLPGP